jgi:hypothetical protein
LAEDNDPTPVFLGKYTEALFLKTLLESAGIETSEANWGHRGTRARTRLYVRRADAQHASELVEDFLQNGKRTTD